MRRVITLSLLLAFGLESTGCYSWHQETSPVPRLDRSKPTDRYRITLAGGRVIQLTNLHVQGDSLLGAAVEHGTGMVAMGFPLTHVNRIERPSLDAAGTVTVVRVVAVLATISAAIVAFGHIAGGGTAAIRDHWPAVGH